MMGSDMDETARLQRGWTRRQGLAHCTALLALAEKGCADLTRLQREALAR